MSNASSERPPALLTADNYDTLICGACVRAIPTLRRYAGTPGVLMVVRDALQQPWKVVGKEDDTNVDASVEVAEGAVPLEVDSDVGGKRARSPGDPRREYALDGIRTFNEMRCVSTCIPVRYVLTVR